MHSFGIAYYILILVAKNKKDDFISDNNICMLNDF